MEHLENLSPSLIAESRTEIWHLSCGSGIRFWQRLTTYQRMFLDRRKSLSINITTSFIEIFCPQCQLENSGLWSKKKRIGNEVMTFMLPFATTYLCEQGFLALTVINIKARNRLDPVHNMRITLNKIEPYIEVIMKKKLQFRQSYRSNDFIVIKVHCFKVYHFATGCLCLVFSLGI